MIKQWSDQAWRDYLAVAGPQDAPAHQLPH